MVGDRHDGASAGRLDRRCDRPGGAGPGRPVAACQSARGLAPFGGITGEHQVVGGLPLVLVEERVGVLLGDIRVPAVECGSKHIEVSPEGLLDGDGLETDAEVVCHGPRIGDAAPFPGVIEFLLTCRRRSLLTTRPLCAAPRPCR